MVHPYVDSIGLLGGTFDPVHIGHIRLMLELQGMYGFDQIQVIPCKHPVHKPDASVTAVHRQAMLALALEGLPGLSVNACEIERDAPSYTVDTLRLLRQQIENPLILILGTDAFLSFKQWHCWEAILSLSNVCVVTRPGFHLTAQDAAYQLWQTHRIEEEQLHQGHGGIFYSRINLLSISSSMIRRALQCGQNPRYLLPDTVLDYIREHSLYQEA